MSVSVMSMVIKHYPGDGGEYTLALCLADFANDSGGAIFPSVETLAHNSRQSARTVQRQLRFMEEVGWLECLGRGGGAGRATRYRINPDWIADPACWKKGDKLSPFSIKKGDTSVTVPEAKRVTSEAKKGDIAVSPEPPKDNHQEPVRPTFENPGSAVPSAGILVSPDSDPDQAMAEWMFGLVQTLHPNHKPPNWKRWCREIRLMRDRDKRSPEQIAALFRWANQHNFWAANILSPGKLREKWDQLVIQLKASRGGSLAKVVEVDQRCVRCNDGTHGRRHVPGVGWLCNTHIDQHESAHA